MPPYSRNQRTPTGEERPAARAASSLVSPAAIASQNGRRAARCNTGDRNRARVQRLDRRFPVFVIARLTEEVLRRPIESTQYSAEDFQRLLADLGVTCSMSRSGDVWDNSVMESFFSTLKIERCHRKQDRTRQDARADIFDYIERFYNPTRRHSTWATSTRSRSSRTQR